MKLIKKWEEKIIRKDLVYKANKYKYDFQQYETIRSFGASISSCKISVDKADINQNSLLDSLKDFDSGSRPKATKFKNKKRNSYKSAYALYEGRKLVLNAFRSGLFRFKSKQNKMKQNKIRQNRKQQDLKY